MVWSALVYGAATLILLKVDLQALEVFQVKCLISVGSTMFRDQVTNKADHNAAPVARY